MLPYAAERLVDDLVAYTVEIDGILYVIESVPARVNVETGERIFAPETVTRLQQIVWEGRTPSRTIETRVFEYAA
jgi:hypothetical protein